LNLELIDVMSDVTKDLLVTAIIAGAGVLAKTGYDIFRRRWRLRHMRNIFGELDDLDGDMLTVMPVFNPMSEDNFAGGELSRLKKQVISNNKGTRLETTTVPLFSDVLVIDDFKAFRQVERLFAEHRYGFIDFCPDIDALTCWDKRLIICFGGPRSNQKLRQIMNLPTCSFIDVDDSGELLSDWTLHYDVAGESGEYRSTDEDAYSYLFKTDNPNHPEGKLIGVAGDSAVSTFMAASYLRENLVPLSRQFEDSDFLLILHADRSNLDSLRQEKALPLP
jgi:hypothetical protein